MSKLPLINNAFIYVSIKICTLKNQQIVYFIFSSYCMQDSLGLGLNYTVTQLSYTLNYTIINKIYIENNFKTELKCYTDFLIG